MVNLEIVAMVNKCSPKDVHYFFQSLIDVCCNEECESTADLFDPDSDFVTRFVPSVWPTESIFYEVCDYLVEELSSFGADFDATIVDENVYQTMMECIDMRRQQMQKAIACKIVGEKHRRLTLYDYQVSVVMSTDRLATNNKVTAKVVLVVARSKAERAVHGENGTDTLSFELNKEELANFLEKLQAGIRDLNAAADQASKATEENQTEAENVEAKAEETSS